MFEASWGNEQRRPVTAAGHLPRCQDTWRAAEAAAQSESRCRETASQLRGYVVSMAIRSIIIHVSIQGLSCVGVARADDTRRVPRKA